jgi:hypothetical protein
VAVPKAVKPGTGEAKLLGQFRDSDADPIRLVISSVRTAEHQIVLEVVRAEEFTVTVTSSGAFSPT